MNRIRIPLLLIFSLLIPALSACGFYLKGQRPLPPALSSVYIDYQAPYEVVEPAVQTELRAQLEQRGAKVTTEATSTASRISILKLNQAQRTESVGPTGKAIEYELATTVEFDFRVNGEVRIPRQTLTVQRDYSFDETQLLAKEAQREKLQREMQQELAGLIMLRLDAGLASNGSSTPPAAAGQ